MPGWLFWTYVRQRPRLDAEERIEQIAVMSAGTGHMTKSDYETYTAALRRQIDENRSPARATRPKSLEALAAMGGVAVVVSE